MGGTQYPLAGRYAVIGSLGRRPVMDVSPIMAAGRYPGEAGIPPHTNLELDDKLIETARRLGGHKTKREAVSRALEEYVQWLKQQAIVSEFGKIDYDPKYDHKKQRKIA